VYEFQKQRLTEQLKEEQFQKEMEDVTFKPKLIAKNKHYNVESDGKREDKLIFSAVLR